jgi:hypothetical protein
MMLFDSDDVASNEAGRVARLFRNPNRGRSMVSTAAQKCTTGLAVACPRSPREGPARGRGLWAHGGKRVVRMEAGVAIGSA